MTFLSEPISHEQFLLNRLMMLSSLSVAKLAEILQVSEAEVMQHPQFEEEANKMIDKITF